MIHLIEFLLKLLLKFERGIEDNTKLVGSLLLAGVWLLLLTEILPGPFGSWLEGAIWCGWGLVGLGAFLFLRRKIGRRQNSSGRRKRRSLFEV